MNISPSNYESMNPELVCIYSLPRSGSTVLIAELDRIKGITCLPESYFPQILELLSPEELYDSSILAAFFLASSPSGSLLSFEEAKECMVPGSWYRTLANLGLACAHKTKRNPADVSVVVWKTTRIVGRWKLFSETGGRFIILRRNPLNVFESQFRVNFGRNNRNPFRFAMFLQSYEAVFSRYPKVNTHFLEYEAIPQQLPTIQTWLKVGDAHWPEGISSLQNNHAKKTWHSGLLDGFQSQDHAKRKNIPMPQRILLISALIITRPLRTILGNLRDYYDKAIMNQIRTSAKEILAKRL